MMRRTVFGAEIDSARWLGDGYGETDSRLFKLLRYCCFQIPFNPQQAVRERNVGPWTICDRYLSYSQLSSADHTKSEISIHILENIVIVSSMW